LDLLLGKEEKNISVLSGISRAGFFPVKASVHEHAQQEEHYY
jgi:hypothetical protein